MSIQGNWDRRISRRSFIGVGGMSAAALMLGSKGVLAQEKAPDRRATESHTLLAVRG